MIAGANRWRVRGSEAYLTTEEERARLLRRNAVTLVTQADLATAADVLKLPPTEVERLVFEAGRPDLLPCLAGAVARATGGRGD